MLRTLLRVTGRVGGSGNRDNESSEANPMPTGTSSDGILPTYGVGGTNIFKESPIVGKREIRRVVRGPPVPNCPSSPFHDLLPEL